MNQRIESTELTTMSDGRSHTVVELRVAAYGGLVGPAAGDVTDGVSAPAEQQQRQVEALHVAHGLRVSLYADVEAAEPVAGQRVRSALQDHRFGPVPFHHLADHLYDESILDGNGRKVERPLHWQ